MSAGVLLTLLLLASLASLGLLIIARWLWRPVRIRSRRGPRTAEFPEPDEPLDRTIYETFEELGVADDRRPSGAAPGPSGEATEFMPLESVFPTPAGERTEYLAVDPEWSASEPGAQAPAAEIRA